MTTPKKLVVFDAYGTLFDVYSIAQAAEHGLQNPEWHCQTCGHNSALWHTLCDHCGGFDTQVWESSQTHPVTRTPDQHVLLPGE